MLNIKDRLNVILTNNTQMCKLHKKYLDDASPTDVISFHSYEINGFLGEVVVNVELAKKVAKENGIDPKEEILRYICHGILHLLGYKDDTAKNKKVMWDKQEKLLKSILP
jgi:rRNA maturation RNase YbeY